MNFCRRCCKVMLFDNIRNELKELNYRKTPLKPDNQNGPMSRKEDKRQPKKTFEAQKKQKTRKTSRLMAEKTQEAMQKSNLDGGQEYTLAVEHPL